METAKPILSQAKEFADGVHAVWPEQMLAYNLSPSFNWDAAGLNEQTMKSYVFDLGKLGFAWQFITLAGLHSNAYISAKFAKAFKTEGMKAYVEEVQRKEREIGCDVLTHQKWSGAELVDSLLKTITGGVSSTAAMGAGVTYVCSGSARLTCAARVNSATDRSRLSVELCTSRYLNVIIAYIRCADASSERARPERRER